MSDNTLQTGTANMRAVDRSGSGPLTQAVALDVGVPGLGNEKLLAADAFGRLPTNDIDPEHGLSSGITTLRDKLVAQRYTVLSDSIADGYATFWVTSNLNGGTSAVSGGEGITQTSASASSAAQLLSSPVLTYLPGQVAWFNSAVRFGDTGSVGNTRRIGPCTVNGSQVPQEGFYFELADTVLNAVVVKAGTATATALTAWSRAAVAPFTLDANYHSLEIRWTANRVDFIVDNIIRHTVAGTTSPITSTLNFPLLIQSINTTGSSSRLIAVRNIGMGGFGQPSSLSLSPTQFGTALVPADAGSAPISAPTVGYTMAFNGAAWDRLRSKPASTNATLADPSLVVQNPQTGAQVDTAATTDTGTFSLIALFKRLLTKFPGVPTTGAQTNVTGVTTDATILAANTARKGATITNDSTATLYLLLASATSSATVYSVALASQDYYEVPFGYTGVIKGIWSAAAGSARVTELI